MVATTPLATVTQTGLAWKQVEEGRKQNEEEGLQIKEAWLIEQPICCLCIIWNMVTDLDNFKS